MGPLLPTPDTHGLLQAAPPALAHRGVLPPVWHRPQRLRQAKSMPPRQVGTLPAMRATVPARTMARSGHLQDMRRRRTAGTAAAKKGAKRRGIGGNERL